MIEMLLAPIEATIEGTVTMLGVDAIPTRQFVSFAGAMGILSVLAVDGVRADE